MADLLSRVMRGAVTGSIGALAAGAARGRMFGGVGGILTGMLAKRLVGGGTVGSLATLAMGLGGMKVVAVVALVAWLMRGRGGAEGLAALTERLGAAGLADRVQSWIAGDRAKHLRPEELERAIPPEELAEVERRTGLPREEILAELGRTLPSLVDRLTPKGRLPSRDEELEDCPEDDLRDCLGLRREAGGTKG